MDEIEKSYFEKLYHSYIKLMFAHASHYVRNSVDIEDIVQESLVKILPKYSVLSSLVDLPALGHLQNLKISKKFLCSNANPTSEGRTTRKDNSL